ncbi:hypothetical protein [Pelagibacterium xiamenense]|uniref:hypothetical protein n=1 Tax=Pelagibacterium xiamenense TaxID=2901140 RepID=UPI001E3E5143|nr:hypothetical protein [Pelagibacterium xiamenense]MCD7060061.1 hypothetical protein [Pelagibacterium xiamenense]
MADFSHRAATSADIGLIHRELMDLIDSMPYYNERFKTHEKARFDKRFLRTLLAIDPWHILILEVDNAPGGFSISGPDCGTIFQYWSCVFPAHRKTMLGMYGMRAFIEHWDNSRFHKASTYVRTDNKIALRLLERYDYECVAVLEQHIFGQDYCVMERKFTKATGDYDRGVWLPFGERIKIRLQDLFDR